MQAFSLSQFLEADDELGAPPRASPKAAAASADAAAAAAAAPAGAGLQRRRSSKFNFMIRPPAMSSSSNESSSKPTSPQTAPPPASPPPVRDPMNHAAATNARLPPLAIPPNLTNGGYKPPIATPGISRSTSAASQASFTTEANASSENTTRRAMALGNRGGSRYSELFHRKQTEADHVATLFAQTALVDKTATNKAMANSGSKESVGKDTSKPWFFNEEDIRKYYERSIWASFEVRRPSAAPSAAEAGGEETTFTPVNVEEGDQLVTVTLPVSAAVRDVIKSACEQFGYWDDYNYRLFYTEQSRWLAEDESISSLALSPYVVLKLGSDGNKAKRSPSKGSSLNTMRRKRTSISGALFGKPEFKKKLKPCAVYLTVILFNTTDNRVLFTPSGILPSVTVVKEFKDKQGLYGTHDDFLWALKRSLDFEDMIREGRSINVTAMINSSRTSDPNDFRNGFLMAIDTMRGSLGTEFFGCLHDEPIIGPDKETHLVVMLDVTTMSAQFGPNSDLVKGGTLVWRPAADVATALPPGVGNSSDVAAHFPSLCKSRSGLEPGLYIGLFYAYNNFAGLDILVPKTNRLMLPVIRLRDNVDVKPHEWQWLRGEDNSSAFFASRDSAELARPDELLKQERRQLISRQRSQRQKPTGANGAAAPRLPQVTPAEEEMQIFQGLVLTAVHQFMSATGLTFSGSDLFPQLVPIDEDESAKMLVFVRPMLSLTDTSEAAFDSSLYCLVPLPVFETLHHHVFNNRRSRAARRRGVDLDGKLILLEENLKLTNDGKQRMDLQVKINELQARATEERQLLRDLSWSLKLFDWERNRAYARLTRKMAPK